MWGRERKKGGKRAARCERPDESETSPGERTRSPERGGERREGARARFHPTPPPKMKDVKS